jgi:hypothetical protein
MLKPLFLSLLCLATLLGQEAPKPDAPKPDAPKPDAPKPEAAKPEPPKEKSFADTVKDLKVLPGLFTLYQNDEKLYLEILPAQLDQVHMFNVTCESGIGDGDFFGGEMCGETPFVFHKLGKNIQLLAKNPRYTAQAGTPMARTVARSFSDSVLGNLAILSAPHPERKSLLIDIGSWLLSDIPFMTYRLELAFRLNYRFDAKNSSLGATKAFPRNLEMETTAHYVSDRLPVPPMLPPGAPVPPQARPPRTLPDARSLFLKFRYGISALPEPGYEPRLADDRMGFFTTDTEDYTKDVKESARVRRINRWRLEKADPSAALSKPKQPIVYWLENAIPVEYREPIRQGILEWNKAFEKAGFLDAVEVKQQPDDADWDPADIRYSTVRWITAPGAGFAQGPSSVNPYTGEIYNADIRFSSEMTRFVRQEVSLTKGPLSLDGTQDDAFQQARDFRPSWSLPRGFLCDYTTEAVRDAEFSFDVLATRGIEPGSPEADKFVFEFLKEIATHEVGHTLGLRHNFKASTIRTLKDAQNRDLTSKEGLVGSIMEYIPGNLAAKGETQGEFHMTTVGPWDKWVIEWGYKPGLDQAALDKIASRAAEPQLAYNTDEDAGFSSLPFDMDPLTARFDFGPNPIEFAEHRAKLAKEVWAGLESKLEKPGEGYQVLLRAFAGAYNNLTSSAQFTTRFIGGVYHHRDHVGDPSGRLPYVPVPAEQQRAALKLLQSTVFDAKTFDFSPQLLNKLASNRFSDFSNFSPGPATISLHQIVLSSQRRALERVLHPLVLQRVIDGQSLSAAATRFRLSELFDGLQSSIWSELKAATPETVPQRRNLQREHLRRLIAMVAQGGGAPEDARTLARYSLKSIRAQLTSAMAKPASVESRAHFDETAARIDEALKASITRTTF